MFFRNHQAALLGMQMFLVSALVRFPSKPLAIEMESTYLKDLLLRREREKTASITGSAPHPRKYISQQMAAICWKLAMSLEIDISSV